MQADSWTLLIQRSLKCATRFVLPTIALRYGRLSILIGVRKRANRQSIWSHSVEWSRGIRPLYQQAPFVLDLRTSVNLLRICDADLDHQTSAVNHGCSVQCTHPDVSALSYTEWRSERR